LKKNDLIGFKAIQSVFAEKSKEYEIWSNIKD
jgi:hypothetical protein